MDPSSVPAVGSVAALDWSAWVTAGATVILAVLTAVYVIVTARILATQSDPCVVLTVVHDEDRSTILQLVAKNIGAGIAHDIRFEFSRSLPARAFGLSKEDAKNAVTMEDGPLINGIPALGPGETRKIDWGQYGGLLAALGDKPIIATCRFKKSAKEMSPTICPLEVASFAGTVAAETSAARAARELEKISRNLQHLVSGFSKLKVEVVSLPVEKKDDNGV